MVLSQNQREAGGEKKENPGLPASLSASASLTESVSLHVSLSLSLSVSLSLSPQDSRDALRGAGTGADFYTTTRDLGAKSNLVFVIFHLICHFTSCKKRTGRSVVFLQALLIPGGRWGRWKEIWGHY